MKKILALALVAVMTLTLVGCGKKVDKTAVTEALNSVTSVFDATATLINDNQDIVDQESIDFMKALGEDLTAFKTEIESDDLTQERADELAAELLSGLAGVEQVKANVEAFIANGGTEAVTEEQIATLDQLVAELTEYATGFAAVFEGMSEPAQEFVAQISAVLDELLAAQAAPQDLTATAMDELLVKGQGALEASATTWAQIEAELGGEAQG